MTTHDITKSHANPDDGDRSNTETTAQMIESLVLKGDISTMGPEARAKYYIELCASLGLTAATQPFAILRLNGKEIMYPTRGATDQLAAIHRLDREIIDGPRVMDVAGTKMIYCVCRVRHPNGRTETAVATVPMADPLNALMKAECVPLDSEILTRRGFKPHHELRIGEEVLAYDCATDQSHWVPLENVSVYTNVSVSRLHTAADCFSARCTVDHSWAIKRPAYRPRGRTISLRPLRGPYTNRSHGAQLVKASKINTGQKIVLAASCFEGDHPLSPERAEVLGWVMTDGTIKRAGNFLSLKIYQSKPERVVEIRELLARAGYPVREWVGQPTVRTFPSGQTYDCLPQHVFTLSAEESRRLFLDAGIEGPADMPRLVTRLSPLSRSAMLRAMMAADACARGRFGKKRKPGVMDAWQILCTLEGIALGKPGVSSVGEVPTQTVLDARFVHGANLRLDPDGQEDVWCPTTKFGTWVMRQSGRVMITGNTKAKRRGTLSILGLGALDEPQTEELPVSYDRDPARNVAPSDGSSMPADGAVQGQVMTMPEELQALALDLQAVELPAEVVAVWIKHREALSKLASEHKEAAWKSACDRVEVVGKLKNAKVWLKRAVAEETARRDAGPQGEEHVQ